MVSALETENTIRLIHTSLRTYNNAYTVFSGNFDDLLFLTVVSPSRQIVMFSR